ncbi:hypothetical protein [Deinococcus metallilatus]|uniref:Helix-turn-helix domain-containing protein n=1 Tax=Deinococcus metallilatus TaxID=1211322 RepID=A0ABR6MZW7_9DEIO|nr:hypothetical protein [Deinococcus metallilatus]MBB5297485.1 hypothetical protein [Deinococcus metallilatus]
MLPRGPRRLLELLHGFGVDVVGVRGYAVVPSQVTLHQPQEVIARALRCCLKSVYNWTRHLEALGLVDARPHFTTSKGTTRADGTLYAVSLKPGHRAHLTHADLSHEWRDLDADREAGRTAWKLLTGSDPREEAEWYQVLRDWAVTPGSFTSHPLKSDPVNGPETVQDVIYTLPLLAEAHPTKRAALVGMLGAALARRLDGGMTWRRLWCRLIWDAWTAEVEGRGGLQVLAAQLARLEADRREWPGLRSPGALLASRLREAA